MTKATNISKKRSIYIFGILAAVMLALCLRAGYIQIVKGETYTAMAENQQTRNKVVSANRGSISDRNGDIMAVSATTYVVWARPANIPKKNWNLRQKNWLSSWIWTRRMLRKSCVRNLC